jgi:hypothetical protein
MTLIVSKSRLYIELLNGSLYEVTKLPIKLTEEFRNTLAEINNLAATEDLKDLTILSAYSENKLFAHLVDRSLSLIGLTVEDISSEVLHNLLFPHQLENGDCERQGSLVKYLLGEISGGSNVPEQKVQTYIQLIGNLWASLTSFNEVQAAIENLDYETLAGALEQRSEMMKPDRNKKAAMDSAREAFKNLPKLTQGAEIDFQDL